MNILITGSKGFIGKNLIAQLYNIKNGKAKNYDLNEDINIYEYDIDTDILLLDKYCENADFVFNLAGVNRPQDEKEFMQGNFGFASILLDTLKKHNNTCPVMISSSTQALQNNLYGESKRAGEQLLCDYSKETGSKVLVYRFPNVFGKWCRPNYNSAIATFCNNIANDIDIQVNDPSVEINLIYIDDLVNEMINALSGNETRNGEFCEVPIIHSIKLGDIVELIHSFKDSRNTLAIMDMSDAFTKKLYSTYLSYLSTNDFSYPLKMNVDNRGSFTELIRTIDRGQVSISITKPHIAKGQHWHHTKNEKFVVVAGNGVIRFRNLNGQDQNIIEYFVSGDKIEVVDVPIGYTHNIENIGETDLVTVMWCNECFNPNNPDTYFEEV